NPATHIVTVELPVDIWQADLQLFDIQGRLIKQETIHHKSVLDVSGLHPGLYLYKAVTGKHNYNGKLLITRQ
ncbi:MAG: T9SS type A sorting domain-containing protein, partial [Bacteroidales bacterium]|nr:T9SS type A sorting domain-containing protein [Bacteroidales bacterium]